MKLVIERNLLLKALAHTQSIVERRQTIPVLANVLIEATGSSVLLKATDSEIEIQENISANILEQGAVTAPAHKLYDIVNKLPDGCELTLSLNEENRVLSLVAGRAKFSLPTLPAEDFPTLQQAELPYHFELASSELLYLLNKTSFAISLEETRYNLNGIYLHAKEGETPLLAAVATDGHRLALSSVSLPVGATGMPGVIIPRKTIAEITKLAGESENNLDISLSNNQICFRLGSVILLSRLIDGTYPDYEKVIPNANDKVLLVDADNFAKVVSRVSVIQEKSRGIKLSLQTNVLTVFIDVTDEGAAEDELEVSYENEAFEIGFNFRYLLDILSQLKGVTARLVLKDSSSPIIVEDSAQSGALFVLMPMRV